MFPIKLNSDDHETLTLFFKRDGLLLEMIIDNYKEQLSRDFHKKLCEANCHQKTIEPPSPCGTAADMNIRELNHGCSRNTIKIQYQKRLWDRCDDLEACIFSCTTHAHYSLDVEVPETVTKGHTADISIICKYE